MLGIIPYAGIDLAVYEVGSCARPPLTLVLFSYYSSKSKQSFPQHNLTPTPHGSGFTRLLTIRASRVQSDCTRANTAGYI